jgi:hypothetical protein
MFLADTSDALGSPHTLAAYAAVPGCTIAQHDTP